MEFGYAGNCCESSISIQLSNINGSGDMVAFMHNGALIIQEAGNSVGSSSSIQLSSVNSGAVVRVRGVTHPDGTVTRIGNENSKNFTAYKDFKVNDGNVFISTGAGSDVVEVLPNTIIRGNLDIKTSTSGASYIHDYDKVFLNQIVPLKTVNIVTGTGDDVVEINTLKRMVSGQRLDVNTGFGNDTVLMYGHDPYSFPGADQGTIRIQTYENVNQSAYDHDTVHISDTKALNLGILLGGGNDQAIIVNTQTPRVTVYAHGGNDTVHLDNVYAHDAVFASLGEGDDFLSLGPGGVLSNAFDAYGDGGYDTFTRPRYFKYGSTYSSNPYLRIKSGFEAENVYDTYYYSYDNVSWTAWSP